MTTDYADWLNNLAGSVDQLYRLVTGAAYIMGCAFLFKAIYSLKVYGEMRTMMSSNASLKEPLVYLLVAVAFIYLPSAFDVFMNTAFGSESVLSYDELPSELNFNNANGGIALIRILQLIGAIGFIRGWVLIARAQAQGSQPGTLGKGIIHLFSGILLMNAVATIDVVYNTLGITF